MRTVKLAQDVPALRSFNHRPVPFVEHIEVDGVDGTAEVRALPNAGRWAVKYSTSWRWHWQQSRTGNGDRRKAMSAVVMRGKRWEREEGV